MSQTVKTITVTGPATAQNAPVALVVPLGDQVVDLEDYPNQRCYFPCQKVKTHNLHLTRCNLGLPLYLERKPLVRCLKNQRLLALPAIVLELPEDYLVTRHRYDESPSDCYLRHMKHDARDAKAEAKLDNVWLKSHTNFGSLTLLFRQPVAALQVRGKDGDWKWVKAHNSNVTVNVADALEFLTNGSLKSSIRRVMVPPPDQAGVDRLDVLYFVPPEDSLELRPVQSEVLDRLGCDQYRTAEMAGITAGQWVKARVRAGVSRTDRARSEIPDQEIVHGAKAKSYA
ncbi:hypothetical protein LZ30DRAFT_780936 [Colletotrichum cereale]|nr:hypothetical protein LZ30DRAFT_780936 [Colletotrichum cereale]